MKKPKKINPTILSAIIGLFGTILGAFIGGFLARTNNISPQKQPNIVSTQFFRSTASSTTVEFVDYDPLQKTIPMRYIPAGSFLMGADAQSSMSECQKYRNDCQLDFFRDEEPVHTVYLEAFYIDKYEVTNFLYASCVSTGACDAPSQMVSDSQYDNYPVIYVNWYMANTYCRWRGGRLPSEAQWEKAARGTTGRTFPWGNEIDCGHANYWDWNQGKHCIGHTTEVGQYSGGVSPFGVYDMAGNVWEWTSSLYLPYPYNSNDGREDLSAFGSRVARGGGWFYYFYGLPRSTERLAYDPSESGNGDFGFRCVHLTP